MGMTMIQKILARASGRDEVAPGEYVVAKIDKVMVLGERLGDLAEEGVGAHWPSDVTLHKIFDSSRHLR